MPYLKRAEGAVDSIKPPDIVELKGIRAPAAICRMILDTVHILFMLPLVPVTPKTFSMKNKDLEFISDSFELPNIGS